MLEHPFTDLSWKLRPGMSCDEYLLGLVVQSKTSSSADNQQGSPPYADPSTTIRRIPTQITAAEVI